LEQIQKISWTQLAGLIIATKLTGTLTYGYIVTSEPFGKETWIVPFIAGTITIVETELFGLRILREYSKNKSKNGRETHLSKRSRRSFARKHEQMRICM